MHASYVFFSLYDCANLPEIQLSFILFTRRFLINDMFESLGVVRIFVLINRFLRMKMSKAIGRNKTKKTREERMLRLTTKRNEIEKKIMVDSIISLRQVCFFFSFFFLFI